MLFSAAAVLAFVASAVAQTAGFAPITKPGPQETIPAGSSYQIGWQSTDAYTGTVTISLLGGSSPGTLQPLGVLATSVDITAAAYSWAVDSSLGSLSTYGIKISLDSDPTTFQYSNPFAISGGQASVSVSSTATASITASATGTGYSLSSSSETANVTATVTTEAYTTLTTCTTSATVPAGNLSTTANVPKTTVTSFLTPSASGPATKTSAPATIATSGATSVAAGSIAMLGALAAAMLTL